MTFTLVPFFLAELEARCSQLLQRTVVNERRLLIRGKGILKILDDVFRKFYLLHILNLADHLAIPIPHSGRMTVIAPYWMADPSLPVHDEPPKIGIL